MRFKTCIWFTLLLSVLSLALSSSLIQADTLNVRIATGDDDVEERISNGGMYMNSSDIELIYDWQDQVAGLRFNNITIPPSATINNAYIEFETDDTSNRAGSSLVIVGQKSSNASAFSSSAYNVSSRAVTNAVVSWAPSNWNSVSEKHQTPDLSSIVQEIIGISGWGSGNNMVFMIAGTGTRRSAEAFEGEASNAALLHIDYSLSAPEFEVTPGDFTMTIQEGTNVVADSFVIKNTGTDVLYYAVSDDATWLTCSPTSGTLNPDASTAITVTYSTSALSAGIYSGAITLTDTDDDNNGAASNSPFTVPVNLTVQGVPVIDVTPVTLTPSAVQGTNADPGSFKLTNSGTEALSFSITADASWLTLSPANGMLSVGNFVDIGVSYNVSTMAAGTYIATITVVDDDPDGFGAAASKDITVTMTIDSLPYIVVSPSSLSPEGDFGLDATADTFTLTNSGTADLNFKITDDMGWVSCAPETGTLAPGAVTTITVNYTNNALAEGIYVAQITIVDTDTDGDGVAPNSGLTLPVNLSYGTLPVISVSPNTFTTYAVEGVNAPTGSFELQNTGISPLNYSISVDATWLSCSLSTGDLQPNGSVQVNVTFASASLSPGYHEATIKIIDLDSDTDGAALNSPFEYDVGLIVYAEATGSSCGDVPVYTENLVSPAMLVLLDVSGSMTSPAPLDTEGVGNPQTPELKDIVQEIVNRSGWTSGNGMSFIITGSGHRTATSYNDDPGLAPQLHIEYTGGVIDLQVADGNDDAEENAGTGSMYLTSSDLELIYDGHDQVVGLRFQNVAIPQNANITTAYIEFVINETQSEATSLTIRGEDTDNSAVFNNNSYNISNRSTTSASVSWNNIEQWGASRRIDVGKSVISELVKDDSISWGYGSWCFDSYDARNGYEGDATSGSQNVTIGSTTFSVPTYPAGTGYYTRVHVGTKFHDSAHQQDLQDAIAATDAIGGTPLGPSLLAAREYFNGVKKDEVGSGSLYSDPGCQPKILIDITDGLGYSPHTSADYMEVYTNWLADAGVSAVAVGFGIDNASQIQRMASVSNERGNESDNDDIYALHNEVSGVGQPFLANSRQELIDALRTITSSLKAQVFHGSAPAPTTSVDYGNIVITAKFDATDWSGGLIANEYNADTGTLESERWSATDIGVMPDSNDIKAYTVDSSGVALSYSDPSLSYLYPYYSCKPLGDIINSTPVIVENPAFYYPFDGYPGFRDTQRGRNKLVYIGANDGALHAFDLGSGEEKWRFYPFSLHGGLDASLVGTDGDLCNPLRTPAGEYCHKYFVDGSPVAGDVYDGTNWSTVLVTGLAEGGESYFALDVTGGKSFDDDDDGNLSEAGDAKFLWEFTDSELGLAKSEPAIARVCENEDCQLSCTVNSDCLSGTCNKLEGGTSCASNFDCTGIGSEECYTRDGDDCTSNTDCLGIGAEVCVAGRCAVGKCAVGICSSTDSSWAVFVGSGYSGTSQATKEAYLYGISVHDKSAIWDDGGTPTATSINKVKISSTTLQDDALASPLLVDLQDDYINDVLYVGNLYGTMYRAAHIGKGETPIISKLFNLGRSDHANSIRSKADFAYAEIDADIWVYFGTGKYENSSDKTTMEQQYFVGLQDDDALRNASEVSGNATYYWDAAANALGSPTEPLKDIETKKIVIPEPDVKAGSYRVIKNCTSEIKSWLLKLDNAAAGMKGSERVISQPLVVGGTVFFTTFIPDENVCAGNGEAWLYALDYETGCPSDKAIFDINGDGSFGDPDKIIDDPLEDPIQVVGLYIGEGQPSRPVLEDDVLFVTTTGRGLVPTKVNLPANKAKIRSWRSR